MGCEGCKHYLKGGSACGLCYCYDRFEPKDYPPYLDYPKERKPLTNYDRLIRKTPEELAEAIAKTYGEGEICPPKHTHIYCVLEHGCVKCWLDWLKQEVNNG